MASRHPVLPGKVRDLSARYLPRRPVLVGALITAVATHLLMVAPELIEFRSFRVSLFEIAGVWLWDNPFGLIRFLGGIIGGYVAGYMTRSGLWECIVDGIQAVLLGVVLYYVTSLGWNLFHLLMAGELTLSVLLFLVLQPLIFLFVPLSLLYILQSTLGSTIGTITATLIMVKLTEETIPGDPTEIETALIRSFVVGLICLVLFVVVWSLLFYLRADLFTYNP